MLYISTLFFLKANEDVLQVVEVFHNQSQKWDWLLSHIVEFCSGKFSCLCHFDTLSRLSLTLFYESSAFL